MREWNVLDHEQVPDDEGVIYLMERGGEYVIHVDGRELMSNRLHGSEAALAELACACLPDKRGARILVGGLGMGFTLAAALREVGPTGKVTVAELMPAVVRWNQEYPSISRPAGHPLRDERVEVYTGDVAEIIEHPTTRWDAILLDVDNGPTSLTRRTNGWLYTKRGVGCAWNALNARGVLAIWAIADDPRLTRQLRKAGFEVNVHFFTEHDRPTYDGTGTHVVWVAQRPR